MSREVATAISSYQGEYLKGQAETREYISDFLQAQSTGLTSAVTCNDKRLASLAKAAEAYPQQISSLTKAACTNAALLDSLGRAVETISGQFIGLTQKNKQQQQLLEAIREKAAQPLSQPCWRPLRGRTHQ